MARLSYLDEDERPDLSDLVDQIRGARGGRLIHLYKLLLHSTPVAEGWLALGGALRYKGELDDLARELAIVRVAVLTDSDYELRAHERYARNAGATPEQLDAIRNWADSTVFDDRLRAVLAYTDEMTERIHVREQTFAALGEFFDERQILEITVNVGFYNMVSRVLEALAIDPEPKLPPLTNG